MRAKMSLVHAVAIANLVILLAAAGVGWDMARRYEELVYAFNARNAQTIADAGVKDLAWREYTQAVSDVARQIAQTQTLAKALAAKQKEDLSTALADEFRRGAISSGEIKVLGLSVYDAAMAPAAESWQGGPKKVPQPVIDAVAGRAGAERLKLTWRAWMDGDVPRLSVFSPIGGLRLQGYVGVHADPIHALQALDSRLGMAVEVVTLSDQRPLLSLSGFEIAQDATVRESLLSLRGPSGEALAGLKVRQDVTELSGALSTAGLWSLGLFLLICGGVAAASIALVGSHIRQVRKREAAAAAEIEQQRRQQEAAEEAQREAARAAEVKRRQELLSLADTFEEQVKSVVEVVSSASTETTASAEALSAAAGRTSGLAEVVSGASGQASDNVRTAAHASELLSQSITEIGRQVSRSTDVAGKAAGEASETSRTMRRLSDAAGKIGDVMRLITEIAGQTNLLALNATIEAARAGEAGKGFAVVAGEVKSLANQTARATDDIGAQVGEIQAASREAATSIERIAQTITEINEIAATIAAAVEEQGAATQEIARNVGQAAEGAEGVATHIGGVKMAAAETGDISGAVLEASRELSRQAETLRREVDRFLSTVRAA